MNKIKTKEHPHIFLLLISLVLFSSLLTYLIPAGRYERFSDEASGQTIVIPGSFSYTGKTPVAPWKIPVKFYETITSSSVAKLIFFIFIVGGTFEIIMQSGAINSLCGFVIRNLRNRRELIIPIFVCMFSVFGFTMGLTTASIVFVPIGIAVARALRFDTVTGMAMVMLGTNAGFAAGIFNPFSVGIAQSIAELPIFSGAWLRWLLLIPLLIATSIYIMRKGCKMAKQLNQEESLPDSQAEGGAALWDKAGDMTKTGSFSLRKGFVLMALFCALAIITFGVSTHKWGIPEISVMFLLLGIISGILSGLDANAICSTFVTGSKKMMTGAFIIGIAATMRMVLTQGNILDSITHSVIGIVSCLPSYMQLLGMFYANALLDPVITSGSAHASVVMPLMVPLADALMLSRQSAVFAFQLGDGLVNLVSPISTTLTSCLAISGISYREWTRYYLPLVGIYLVIGTVFMLFAGFIGY